MKLYPHKTLESAVKSIETMIDEGYEIVKVSPPRAESKEISQYDDHGSIGNIIIEAKEF